MCRFRWDILHRCTCSLLSNGRGRTGRSERTEGWKDGRVEGWNEGRVERWKALALAPSLLLCSRLWSVRHERPTYSAILLVPVCLTDLSPNSPPACHSTSVTAPPSQRHLRANNVVLPHLASLGTRIPIARHMPGAMLGILADHAQHVHTARTVARRPHPDPGPDGLCITDMHANNQLLHRRDWSLLANGQARLTSRFRRPASGA